MERMNKHPPELLIYAAMRPQDRLMRDELGPLARIHPASGAIVY
jgi:hypothetical protein